MPCDEQRTISVVMEGLNAALMQETLEELGIYAKYENGKLTSRRGLSEEKITRIKQAYAKKAIRKIAKKHNWAIAQETDDNLTLTR